MENKIFKVDIPKQCASDALIKMESILIETRKFSSKHQTNALIKWRFKVFKKIQ